MESALTSEATRASTSSEPSAPPRPRVLHPVTEAPRDPVDGCGALGLPEWWTARKRAAWERFEALPMPGRKDEDWRFANIRRIQLEGFGVAEGPHPTFAGDLCVESELTFPTVAQAVFANDVPLRVTPLPAELAERGVIWMTLSQALREHGAMVERHFMSQPVGLGSEKFTALHEAHVRNGMVLYMPEGVEIEQPFAVWHWMVGDQAAVFPHTLIVAEGGARVTLLEIFKSSGDKDRGLACGYVDQIAGAGSQVQYVGLQAWSEQALAFHTHASLTERDATSKLLAMHLGAAFTRGEIRTRLAGPGARSELLGLTVAHGTQEIDLRTFQEHAAPHGWSDLLFKNALNHRARTIFQGLIRVDPGASQTDAYQTNRNLLLDGRAEADSMPGLEILNDDVKCSHGTTSGQVDEEQMFYLLARGIPSDRAKQLLVVGFFDEVLRRVSNEAMAGFLHDLLEDKFRRSLTVRLEGVAEPEPVDAAGDSGDVRALQGRD